jgi:hypothetical protein
MQRYSGRRQRAHFVKVLWWGEGSEVTEAALRLEEARRLSEDVVCLEKYTVGVRVLVCVYR